MNDYKLWTYWDKDNTRPDYINLCLKTFDNSGLEWICVTDETVHDYLPALRKDIWDIRNAKGQSPVCHRVDYIRAQLLYKYGGVWLDADTIVLREFDFVSQLEKYRFIGSRNKQNYVRMNFIACTDYDQVMGAYIDAANEVLNKSLTIRSGSHFGSRLLTEAVNSFIDYEGQCFLNKMIIMIPTGLTAPIDWKESNDFFIEPSLPLIRDLFLDINLSYCIALYNRLFPIWFKQMKTDIILQKDMLISELFRKALKVPE